MRNLTRLMGLLGLLLYSLGAQAQYTLTPVAPPPTFTFDDLWHFTVVRSSSDGYVQFYVSLRVFNENNVLQLKSNTATLSLPVGSHYYNSANLGSLQPFNTSFYNATFLQQVVSAGGTFPPGTYNMVYTLFGKANDGEFTPLAEETMQAVVDVMWPPILLWPDDKSVLDNPLPPLSWTPAFSSAYSGAITYDLKIVEILSGQNATQAILSNPGFFVATGLPTTFHQYGAADPTIRTGQPYAWQVTAHLGGVTAQSQVWEFSYANSTPVFVYPTNLFTPVKEVLDGSYHLAKDKMLKIKYTEEYEVGSGYLLYNIYDKSGIKIRSSLPPMASPSVAIKKGDNYITLSLTSSGLNLTSTTDFYLLEVMNNKNEKWYLRFKIMVSSDIPQEPDPEDQ